VVEAARGSLDRTRRFLLRMPQRQARSYLEHTAIVAALKARDPEAAQRAMWQHLDDSMDDIAQRAQANPEMFAFRRLSPRAPDTLFCGNRAS